MAITPVNLGSAANDGTGDDLRTAFGKCNKAISGYDSATHVWADSDWQAAMEDFAENGAAAAAGTSSVNKLASTASNGVAPVSISVGASPFTWTNTTGGNVFVFISGGPPSDVQINGTTVGLDIRTVPLQELETVTVTYTGTAPTMTYKPL